MYRDLRVCLYTLKKHLEYCDFFCWSSFRILSRLIFAVFCFALFFYSSPMVKLKFGDNQINSLWPRHISIVLIPVSKVFTFIYCRFLGKHMTTLQNLTIFWNLYIFRRSKILLCIWYDFNPFHDTLEIITNFVLKIG